MLKKSVVGNLRQQKASPTVIANNVYNELIYGKDNIRSKNTLGTIESVDNIMLDDLKSFYANYIFPSVANMLVVGDIKRDDVLASLSNLNAKWESKNVETLFTKHLKHPINQPFIFTMFRMQNNL